MELPGLVEYAVFSLAFVAIYAVVSLGLNVQWGMTGLFNIGIAAFFAVGAYTSAILTSPPDPTYLGGFGLPFPVGLVGAMIASGILAVLVGLITLNLRADYLAIATIGIAEIIRLVLKNEGWLTGGVRGLSGIPRPLEGVLGVSYSLTFLAIAGAILFVAYLFVEAAARSPWGRVLRAIRENEPTALATGKNIVAFRLQAFVLGSCLMGLGGGLYAHFSAFISPDAFRPMLTTFLVWVMLIAGGSGNNKGALLGALVIWAVWSGTEIVTNLLPAELATRAGALRVLLIGVLLEVILVLRPAGILSEEGQRRRRIKREAAREEKESARHGSS